ncbi:hypothetical protein C8Q75DRAFT_301020 [Abortiporus biennis]|nr:hypothetical protein C8Q75DRAFT_301020 [Abortiporus biennis]
MKAFVVPSRPNIIHLYLFSSIVFQCRPVMSALDIKLLAMALQLPTTGLGSKRLFLLLLLFRQTSSLLGLLYQLYLIYLSLTLSLLQTLIIRLLQLLLINSSYSLQFFNFLVSHPEVYDTQSSSLVDTPFVLEIPSTSITSLNATYINFAYS